MNLDLEPWQALLEQLGRDVELDGLAFSEEGYCSLGLDTGRVLHLDVQEDGLLFMTVLGEAPDGENPVRVLELLLGANAFWVGTQGATLALDPGLRQGPADAQRAARRA
jgi:Tir chaperone protein (CesT) family